MSLIPVKTLSAIFGLIIFLWAVPSLHGIARFKPVTPELRLEAATDYLAGKPDYLGVHVKGFVCNSCGIGLRIHLSKIAGIDKATFEKGIWMDPSKQLLVIAFQPGFRIDLEAVYGAIDRAGYDPYLYYRWTEEGVVANAFQINQ
mgnify:CR=1 FL=1